MTQAPKKKGKVFYAGVIAFILIAGVIVAVVESNSNPGNTSSTAPMTTPLTVSTSINTPNITITYSTTEVSPIYCEPCLTNTSQISLS